MVFNVLFHGEVCRGAVAIPILSGGGYEVSVGEVESQALAFLRLAEQHPEAMVGKLLCMRIFVWQINF